MVPHAGTDTRVWREVVALGQALRRLAPVRGTRVDRAGVALLWDIPSQWALAAARPPTVDVRYEDIASAVHAALFDAHVAVDVVPATGAELDGRRVIIVPTTYLVTPALAARLRDAARDGAHLVVSYLSGMVDETARVLTGGYPGALRDLIGAWAEELCPLREGERIAVDHQRGAQPWSATVWTEHLRVSDGTETLARYASGALAGLPAVTRRAVGAGTVTYLSCRLDPAGLAEVLHDVLDSAGVRPIAGADPDVDVVRRCGHGHRYLFCLNHGRRPAHVDATGIDLLTGRTITAPAEIPPGGALVVDETPSASKGSR
jgi:beta-galactosidase